MKWYEHHPNYGGMPPNAHAWIYHPNFGLLMSPQGGVHLQAMNQIGGYGNYAGQGLTTKPVFGRVYPNGSIGGSQGPYATWYSGSADSPHIEEAKQAVEDWMNRQQIKTAGLPYKFVWADGNMVVAPGWRKDIHHMHLMQELGLTNMPKNMYAGTYNEDDFSGRARISPDWEAYGTYPSEEELVEQIRQRLQSNNDHPGRVARKPW